MEGIILLNGEPYGGEIPKDGALTVCCDAALNWSAGKIRADVLLGDFDTLGYVPEGALRYPARKDFTDGELALRYLLGKGCAWIRIYGAGGGRDDHLFCNIGLLYEARRHGADAVLYTNYTVVRCVSGEYVWTGRKGTTVSLLPVGKSARVRESSGLRYPLAPLTLRAGSTLGLSNVIEEDEARIVCDRGELYVFEVTAERNG